MWATFPAELCSSWVNRTGWTKHMTKEPVIPQEDIGVPGFHLWCSYQKLLRYHLKLKIFSWPQIMDPCSGSVRSQGCFRSQYSLCDSNILQRSREQHQSGLDRIYMTDYGSFMLKNLHTSGLLMEYHRVQCLVLFSSLYRLN